jgi:hypothetical protein
MQHYWRRGPWRCSGARAALLRPDHRQILHIAELNSQPQSIAEHELLALKRA